MHILYVITKANWGGAQRYVFDLATTAQARGDTVAVAYGEGGALAERLREAGIRTIALPGFGRDINLKDEIRAFGEVLELLRRERPELVHVNSSKGSLVLLAARLAGIKRIIFTAHGWAFNEKRPWWQKAVLKILYAVSMFLAHRTICVSEAIRRDMGFMPAMLMTVIRNGIDAPAFRSREDARASLLPDAKDKVWLGMIAELHPTKRVEDAIDALAELGDAYQNVILLVLGEGELRQQLVERIKNRTLEHRVFLGGFTSDASSYLPAFDIFLMPSRTEALAYALIEAGYAGLPVIASRVGGIPEIIRHKETGLLVPPENPHSLALALRQMLDHPEDARKMSEKLKSRTTELFAKERMLAETFAVYQP